MANDVKKLIPGLIALACVTAGCGQKSDLENKIGEKIGENRTLASWFYELSLPASRRFFGTPEKVAKIQRGEEALATMGHKFYSVMGTERLSNGATRTYLSDAGGNVFGWAEGKGRPNEFIRPGLVASLDELGQFYGHSEYTFGLVVKSEQGGEIYTKEFTPNSKTPADPETIFTNMTPGVVSVNIVDPNNLCKRDVKTVMQTPLVLAGRMIIKDREYFWLSDEKGIAVSVEGSRNLGTHRRPNVGKLVSPDEAIEFLGHEKSIVRIAMGDSVHTISMPRLHKTYARATAFKCVEDENATSQIMTEPGTTLATDEQSEGVSPANQIMVTPATSLAVEEWEVTPSMLNKMPIPNKSDGR